MDQENAYQICLGDNGEGLSGGQRQRLAIARALLRDRPILRMEEATSALASESETSVKKALNKLSGGGTTIAVAPRL